jgi:uncharacterized protein (TIGR03435 family)
MPITTAIFLVLAQLSGPAVPVPSFEVASIKPSDATTRDSGGQTGKGRAVMRNVTLKRCMRGAYGVPETQILGGPKWVDENRYDIDARAAGPAGDEELSVMLQSLLTERFQLAFHREIRNLGGYALVVGKNGSKLKVAAPDAPSKTNTRRGRIDAEAATMVQLAQKLSEALKVPVADMTGTRERFDFHLEWIPDELQARAPVSDDAGATATPFGPSIFAALLEQLGLRLVARKVPTEVLVIDRAELPSEN